MRQAVPGGPGTPVQPVPPASPTQTPARVAAILATGLPRTVPLKIKRILSPGTGRSLPAKVKLPRASGAKGQTAAPKPTTLRKSRRFLRIRSPRPSLPGQPSSPPRRARKGSSGPESSGSLTRPSAWAWASPRPVFAGDRERRRALGAVVGISRRGPGRTTCPWSRPATSTARRYSCPRLCSAFTRARFLRARTA